MSDEKYLMKERRKLLDDIEKWVPQYDREKLPVIKYFISSLSNEQYIELLEEYILHLIKNKLERSDMPFAMYFYFYKFKSKTWH